MVPARWPSKTNPRSVREHICTTIPITPWTVIMAAIVNPSSPAPWSATCQPWGHPCISTGALLIQLWRQNLQSCPDASCAHSSLASQSVSSSCHIHPVSKGISLTALPCPQHHSFQLQLRLHFLLNFGIILYLSLLGRQWISLKRKSFNAIPPSKSPRGASHCTGYNARHDANEGSAHFALPLLIPFPPPGLCTCISHQG